MCKYIKTIVVCALALSELCIATAAQNGVTNSTKNQLMPDAAAFDGDNLANATAACSYIFKSGTGWNTSQFCVTVNGNITEFSRPSGVEYLGSTSAGEGYGICDLTFANVSYFDYARKSNSSFGPSTLVKRTLSAVEITRTTNDAFWTLTQTITHVMATPQSPASVVISMSLTNNSLDFRDVTLIRYADVNANGTKVNDFDYTLDTASGLQPNPSGSHGLASTNNTFSSFPTRNWNALAQNVPTGPDPCSYADHTAPQPFIGDGSVLQAWGLGVKSGATVTVRMTYKPI